MATTFATPISAYLPSYSDASLGDVGRTLKRRWRWVAVPTLAAFVASTLFVFVVSPRYTGEAKILLQAGDSSFTRPGPNERGMEQQLPIDEQAVASQVQVVMSRDLAREAIRRLGLVGNEEFDPEVGGLSAIQTIGVMLGLVKDPTTTPPEERVLERYYDNLLVYPVGKSRIVSIEFRSKDAALASRAANTIADLYLGLQEDAKKGQARSASTWLGSNIDGLRKRVADAEAKVEEFRARTGLLMGSGTTTISAQQLSELSGQLAQARAARSDAQAKATLIRDILRDGRAFDIPDVANNELIRRLLEQRINLKAQLALELRTLLPQHPRIKELNAQLSDLEHQIRGAAERTVRTLENDARIAGSRVEALESAIDQQKRVVADANGHEVQLRALEREARAQREQLENYLGRYRDASARDTDYGVPPDARVVSRAVVPQIPSFPKKTPIIGLSTLAAFLLSVGALVSRELLSGGRTEADGGYAGLMPLHRTGDERFDFDLTHLSPGPILDMPTAGNEPALAADPRYDFAALVERVSRTPIAGRGRRVLVTGLHGREDVLRVSRGLGLTLARDSRTVLVDVDADESTPVDAVLGFTDLVGGEATFADVITRQAKSHLYLVGPGTLLNGALTDAPDSVDVALKALDSTHGWVVCALLGEVDGALLQLLAPRVDAVVLTSDLDPASPALVSAFETVQRAGGKDVIVATGVLEPLPQAA